MKIVSELEIIDNMIIDCQSAALCLALTNTIKTEETLKNMCIQKGYRYSVTEFGGNLKKYRDKILGCIVAACIETKVVDNKIKDINAVIEASEEASKGFLITNSDILNIAIKIAVVRDKDWISVAFVGYSALHNMTNHRRACVGVMHI